MEFSIDADVLVVEPPASYGVISGKLTLSSNTSLITWQICDKGLASDQAVWRYPCSSLVPMPIAHKATKYANPGAREDADDAGWLAQQDRPETAKQGTLPHRQTQALAIEKDNHEQHGQAADHSDSGAPKHVARKFGYIVVAVG